MAMFYFIGTIVLYALIAFLVLFGLGGLTKAIIDDHREKRAREDKREADWRHTYDFWQKRCFGFQAEAESLRKDYQEAMQAKWEVIAELDRAKEDLDEQYGFVQGLEMDLDEMKVHVQELEAQLRYHEQQTERAENWKAIAKYWQSRVQEQAKAERALPNMIPASKPVSVYPCCGCNPCKCVY